MDGIYSPPRCPGQLVSSLAKGRHRYHPCSSTFVRSFSTSRAGAGAGAGAGAEQSSILLLALASCCAPNPRPSNQHRPAMSSWLHMQSDRRGARSWKQSWTARALSSCSLPPPRLLAFFAIVVFFLAVSGYVDYKAIERRAEIGARVFAAPVALAAAFLLFAALSWRRRYWATRRRRRAATNPPPATASTAAPWGVAVAVAILLLMMSFQPAVHSMWFRPLWDSDDY